MATSVSKSVFDQEKSRCLVSGGESSVLAHQGRVIDTVSLDGIVFATAIKFASGRASYMIEGVVSTAGLRI